MTLFPQTRSGARSDAAVPKRRTQKMPRLAIFLTWIAALTGLASGPSRAFGAPVAIAIFAGQSNEEAHGTAQAVYGFRGVPGGVGTAGVNAVASCYETTATPSGATAGSGTLICAAPTSGTLYAGQVVVGAGVPLGQTLSAANNQGHFPGVTGTGSNAGGTYVVTPGAVVGSPGSPVAMTFAQPDIGGSGVLNSRCQIWAPTGNKGAGTWQSYAPNVNTDFNGGSQAKSWGPEGPFCARWTADNPGQTLYMVKLAIGGSSLCDLTSGNNYSPEFSGAGIAAFNLLRLEVTHAETALATQFGITSYQIKVIQWGQGEQDEQNTKKACAFPAAPFASATTPVPYLTNLVDMIGHFAVPTTINGAFTGSISGTVLTVSQMTSGAVHRYQRLSGVGVAANTYVGTQISGTTGGTGTYNLQVYQTTAGEVITASGGASCSLGSLSGQFFFAAPLTATKTKITKSCVTGGIFHLGDTLSGAGVDAGTTITALDSAGHTADGLYLVNVNQTVASSGAPEAMTASIGGWGVGADTATFTLFRTFNAANSSPTGVQIGQSWINDHAVTALSAKTVNTDDALKSTTTDLHFHAAWISELGRRLYQSYLGRCDYHAATC